MENDNDKPLRFTVTWRDCKHSVSIPNYNGGEVVDADSYDRLLAEIARLRGVLREVKRVAKLNLSFTPEYMLK